MRIIFVNKFPLIDRIKTPFLAGLILLAAIVLRVYAPDVRPLHSDESGNFFFAEQVKDSHYYEYSHLNFHGPTYFYLAAIFINYFGDSELSLRGPAILFGVLCIILAGVLLLKESKELALLSAIILSLSAGHVFVSRYAIHETMFVFFTLWFALSAYYWIINQSPTRLYSMAAALALMIATKETFVISVFSVVVASLLTFGIHSILRLIFFHKRSLQFAYLLFFLLILLLFSGGFQRIEGINELFKGVPQWIGRGTPKSGHAKPFYYYILDVILTTNPSLLILSILSLVFLNISFLNQHYKILSAIHSDKLFRYCAAWSLITVIVYSYVPYKTPWLAINLTLPMAILSARFLEHLYLSTSRFLSLAACLIIFSSTVLSGAKAIEYTCPVTATSKKTSLIACKPYGPENPYSYVHPTPGMMILINQMKQYFAAHPNARALVSINNEWPFPYYFRNYSSKIDYLHITSYEDKLSSYEILILSNQLSEPHPGFSKQYFRLADYQECFAYFRNKP